MNQQKTEISSIPTDVLYMILANLSPKDRLLFRKVSKSLNEKLDNNTTKWDQVSLASRTDFIGRCKSLDEGRKDKILQSFVLNGHVTLLEAEKFEEIDSNELFGQRWHSEFDKAGLPAELKDQLRIAPIGYFMCMMLDLGMISAKQIKALDREIVDYLFTPLGFRAIKEKVIMVEDPNIETLISAAVEKRDIKALAQFFYSEKATNKSYLGCINDELKKINIDEAVMIVGKISKERFIDKDKLAFIDKDLLTLIEDSKPCINSASTPAQRRDAPVVDPSPPAQRHDAPVVNPSQILANQICSLFNVADRSSLEAFQGRLSWTSFGSCPIKQVHFKQMPGLISALGSKQGVAWKLDVVQPDAQELLKNIMGYTCKLMSETNQNVITKGKIAAAQKLLGVLLSVDDLSSNEAQNAMSHFAKTDVNRGSGCYRIHSLFANKWYRDQSGRNRLVKSTLGELVCDLKKATERRGQAPSR